MVRVYGMSVVGLPDPKEQPELMKDFSEERKKKILRYMRTDSRKQGLGAGILLNHVLKQHGYRMEDITYGSHGKPEIQGLFFNLSHSHDYILCVVSEKPVGCDIEKVGLLRPKVADRYFTSYEADYLNQFSDEEKAKVFYRIWTMKESYTKMTGEGIQSGLKRCEFRMGDAVSVFLDGKRCDCYIKEYDLDGYKVSVCAEENHFSEGIEFKSNEGARIC